METLSFEEVLEVCHIKDEENILLADNYVNVLTAMNIEGELNIYDDEIDLSDLKEYDAGFASLPYFNQTDVRWGRNAYGNSTIASGGCGPTALAMVISGLTNRTVTPSSVASWSVRNGHRAEGAGSYWSLMVDGGEHYGLKVKTVSRKKPNDILEALSEGMPVIASMGKGHFTNGGHFIVLIGVTDSGKILVYDPVSVNRSNQEWDLSIIMNESSRIGGVSGSPFWIFSTD